MLLLCWLLEVGAIKWLKKNEKKCEKERKGKEKEKREKALKESIEKEKK